MSLAGPLMRPRSVALVGASDDPAKTTARPLAYLRKAGFAGEIYPVNPRRDEVMGLPAWPSIEALPNTPDQVFVMTPTDTVVHTLAACQARGVPLVTVLAGGFGEDGVAGRKREATLKAALAGSATRMLGPNSIGFVHVESGLLLTANAAFAEPEIPRGGLFVASHSGSMIGAILSRGLARGLGFAGFVSTGAEIDLSLGDICLATLDDPAIDCYALFLESIRHGDALHRFALAAAECGKPIIAYKLGRSRQAAELAETHTGAIAGEDAVADAFLRELGIMRSETLDGLIEGVALLRAWRGKPRPLRPTLSVVSTTGGGAAMVVDQLGLRGVDVSPPTAATAKALAERGVAASPGRIVDLTLAGTRPEVMGAAIDTLLGADEFDMVVAVAGSSARFQPHLLVPAIAERGAAGAKPLAAFIAPEAPDALARLSAAGVPCFRTPEACGDAIAALFRTRTRPKALGGPAATGEARFVDEAHGYRLLARLGIASAEHRVVDASAATSPIGYPVAVKLASPDVLHKTELGGVVLGVADDAAFQQAAARIAGALASAVSDRSPPHLLVQRMTDGLGEVLLGFRRDPDAGAMVMLAAGGIFAELHQDRSLRLAPIDRNEAEAMIEEVVALRALAGFRGRPRGDLAALADALVALSHAGPDIAEIEINPLIVRRDGQGVIAVDALARIREQQ